MPEYTADLCTGGTPKTGGAYPFDVYGPAYAFNNNTGDAARTHGASPQAPIYTLIAYDFGRPVCIKRIHWTNCTEISGQGTTTSNQVNVSGWTVVACDNGTSWVNIQAFTGLSTASNASYYLNLTPSFTYRYWGLKNNVAQTRYYKTWTYGIGVAEIEMFAIVQPPVNYVIVV